MASILTTGADVGSAGDVTVTVSLNGSTNPLVHVGLMANEDFFVGGLSGTEEVSVDGVDVSPNEIGSALEPNFGMQRDYWLGAGNLPGSGNVDCVASLDNGGDQPVLCALVVDNAEDQAPTDTASMTTNDAATYDDSIDVTPSNADSAVIVTTLNRDAADLTHSVDSAAGDLDAAGAESWANFWQNGGCGYGDNKPASALQIDGDWSDSDRMTARCCVYQEGAAVGGPSTPQGLHWINRGFGAQRSVSLGGELH